MHGICFRRRGTALLILVLVCLTTAGRVAAAEDYPARPVKLIIGYAAGGAVDVMARLVGQRLSVAMGQPFIVENRAGASATIAAETVARSQPDGYTLFVTVPSVFTIVPSTMSGVRVGFKDFASVVEIAEAPLVLMVSHTVQANALAELVALLKAPGSQMTYASPGIGTLPHLATELFLNRIGAKALNVSYRGSSPALQDLMSGQTNMMFDNLSSALPAIKSGLVRPLAVTSRERFPSLPAVPTMAEAGLPDFEVVNWFAIYAPKDTPKPTVERLRAEVGNALRDPDIKQRLTDLGSTAGTSSAGAVEQRIERETVQWSELIKAQGLKLGE